MRRVLSAAAALVLLAGCAIGTEVTETPEPDGATKAAPEPTEPVEKAPEVEVTEELAEVAPLPPDANPALAVAGVDMLPAGEPGQLSVIAQGRVLDRTRSLPVVVRNLTDRPVARVEVSGTVRDESGALVGSGSDHGLNPFVINPGEIAIGYVYFGTDDLPSGATFELNATGSEVDDVFMGGLDLAVAEHNRTSDSIVVMLRNDTDREASGPIGLILMCFDDAGIPTVTHSTYAEQSDAAPGATVSATFRFYTDPPCERYIVGGSGYDF